MKLIEHRLVKFSSSSSGLTRVVRISTTDKDAADSSSGDENERAKCSVTKVEKRSTRPKPQLERNARRRKKKKKKTGNKFRGVRKRPWGRWAAEIRDPFQKKKLWIGGFVTAEEAAIAYDKLAILLRGPDAVTNFGSSSSSGGSNDGVLDPDPDFWKGLSQVVCSPTSVLSSLPAPESKSGHVAAVDSSSGTCGSAGGWNLAEDYGHLDSNFLGDCLYEESPPPHFAVEEVGMAAIPEEDEEENSYVLVELDGDFGSCEWDVNNYFKDPPAVEFSQ